MGNFVLAGVANLCGIVTGSITNNLGWKYLFHILVALIQLVGIPFQLPLFSCPFSATPFQLPLFSWASPFDQNPGLLDAIGR
jgi:uncharacterized membrane protein YccF (DUF307 family)